MLLLLSSGARTRYREDVIRSLALPSGINLQFRYDVPSVEPGVLDATKAGGLVGQQALVCYLFERDEAEAPTAFVPCRVAIVTAAEIVGSSFIIRFRVAGYPIISDNVEFPALLSAHTREQLPRWERDRPKPEVTGPYVINMMPAPIFGTSGTPEEHADAFESIVNRLCRYSVFARERGRNFFTVTGIKKVTVDKEGREELSMLVPSEHGSYVLRSGKKYELEVYSFRPEESMTDEIEETRLHIRSQSELIEFLTTKSHAIDSEYDIKRFRFFTKRNPSEFSASLSLFIHGAHSASEGESEVVIPVLFKRDLTHVIGVGLTALGAALPAMLAAGLAGNLNWWVILSMFGIPFALGFTAAWFQWRRS
jgi:hypothetical protein